MSNLHPTFQSILENALSLQIEREKKSKPLRHTNHEDYLEYHENAEELQLKSNGGYGRGPWF